MIDKNYNIKISNLICINKNIDLDCYLDFVEYVKRNMTHPEWIKELNKRDLEIMLDGGAEIFLYYLNNEIVCTTILAPVTQETLSKFNIDVDYKLIINYSKVLVNPKYVGNGLQHQMLEELNKYSVEKGYEYAICVVHPDNLYSINNFLKDDFKFLNQKEFKRGIRYIYLKKLK